MAKLTLIKTLGERNRRKLRENFNIKNIKQALKKYNVKTDNEAYEKMMEDYNANILKQRADKSVKQKELKKAMKEVLNLGNIAEDKPESRYKMKFVDTHKVFKQALIARQVENTSNLLGDRSFNLFYNLTTPLRQELRKHGNIRASVSFYANYHNDISKESISAPHQLSTKTLHNQNEIAEFITQTIDEARQTIDTFEQRGSGWRFIRINNVYVQTYRYRPLRGGSYIDLPAFIKNKKCCINIKNEDHMCLKYCILYHFNKHEIKHHPERVSWYKKFENQYKFDKFSYPVELKDIPKFEKMVDRAINVFGIQKNTRKDESGKKEECFTPIIIKSSERPQSDFDINLLMLNEGENNHFIYIKDLDVFLTGGKSANYSTQDKKYYCKNCLHGFRRKEQLHEHIETCGLTNACKRVLPQKDEEGFKPTIYFGKKESDFLKEVRAPFAIYADFESFIKPISQCENTDKKSFTNPLDLHEPCGYCFKVVSKYKHHDFPIKLYRGDKPVQHFIDEILKTEDEIMKIVHSDEKMRPLTEQENYDFKNAKTCMYCKKELGKKRDRDHDHITGKYRGASCPTCNKEEGKKNTKNLKIPVFFHNLKNYDGHLIIKGLNDRNFTNIRMIAQNFEKYLTFQISHLKFLDSFNFLTSSLDGLSSNLAKEGKDKFKHTLKGVTNETQQDLLLKKGVYPYEYITDESKFQETKLPSIDMFYSKLNESSITHEEYEHAQKVWKAFNIQNLGEYHDLYLKTDVLLLADVFENFRDVAMLYYELDPAHYLSLPNFAWDAMLRLTDINLEQLTDIDMYQMISKGLRGGISMITHRHGKANNKYMKNFNKKEESSFITYLDANNLYGHAMCQYLPFGDFKWLTSDQFEFNEPIVIGGRSWDLRTGMLDKILNTPEDSKTGYILEVDLEYPKELHDAHNDYPLAPEQKTIDNDMLSEYAFNLKESLNMNNANVPKLVPNLMNKQKYVLHYRNLQYYLKKGMKLTKVHRAIQFSQDDWLKKYIDFNTNKRKLAKNDFEKDFFKLMNNAVFGKTMENVENRVDIKLINDGESFLKKASNPLYKCCQIFDDNLVAMEFNRSKITLDKPIYVGLSVLDLSKLHMYKFHYDFVKEKYGDKARLLFTDTDSLTYHIKTDDLYQDMKENGEWFDFSDYPKEHACFDETNKKIIGKFKDETNSVPIVEFIGLRSKMYSMQLENGEEKRTGKGIKKSALKNKIDHSHFQKCLLGDDKQQLIQFNLIRSTKHQIYTYSVNKVGLSCFDDKRYLLEDGITSYSYGHHKI